MEKLKSSIIQILGNDRNGLTAIEICNKKPMNTELNKSTINKALYQLHAENKIYSFIDEKSNTPNRPVWSILYPGENDNDTSGFYNSLEYLPDLDSLTRRQNVKCDCCHEFFSNPVNNGIIITIVDLDQKAHKIHEIKEKENVLAFHSEQFNPKKHFIPKEWEVLASTGSVKGLSVIMLITHFIKRLITVWKNKTIKKINIYSSNKMFDAFVLTLELNFSIDSKICSIIQ